jgi:hypothetical protein
LIKIIIIPGANRLPIGSHLLEGVNLRMEVGIGFWGCFGWKNS